MVLQCFLESTIGVGVPRGFPPESEKHKPMCSAMGGCLIIWCIISGPLLCQFTTGATPSPGFQEALPRPPQTVYTVCAIWNAPCLQSSLKPLIHSLFYCGPIISGTLSHIFAFFFWPFYIGGGAFGFWARLFLSDVNQKILNGF